MLIATARQNRAVGFVGAVVGSALMMGCASVNERNPDTSGAQPAVPIVVSAPTSQLPVQVTDAAGERVTVTDRSRIVALAGGISETLVALGFGDQIVGRDVTSDFPGMPAVPVVTNGHDISVEGLLALKPTLVLGDGRSGPPEALAAVRAAGVPLVLVPEVWSLSGVSARTTAIAQAVGAASSGGVVNEYVQEQLAQIPTLSSDRPKPVVAFLYLRGTAAVYLLGGQGSGADDMIEAAGGIDAGSRAGLAEYTPLTPESLAQAAPDVLLVMTDGLASVGGVEGLVALPGVAQTPAGRDRRVIAVPDGQLLSFGPRSPATVAWLSERLGQA